MQAVHQGTAREPTQALEALHQRIWRCTRCRLHETRTHAVPGEGPPDPDVMLVGEAPGRQEDEQGRPFVGMAGQALSEILAEAGLRRQEVFITSVIKSRPPGNRTPRKDELAACREWLEEQVALLRPRQIVALGNVAARELIARPYRLGRDHGRHFSEHTLRGYGGTVYLTYHPAAARRNPRWRQAMVADLRGLLEG